MWSVQVKTSTLKRVAFEQVKVKHRKDWKNGAYQTYKGQELKISSARMGKSATKGQKIPLGQLQTPKNNRAAG